MKLPTLSALIIGVSFASHTQRDLVFPLVHVNDHVLGLVATTSSGQSRILRLETRTNGIFLQNTENTLTLTLTSSTGTSTVFERPALSMVLDSAASFGILGLCRGSIFTSRFGSFMMLPELSTGGARLIAAPSNPAQYCFDNQIAYVSTATSKIEAVVDILFGEDETDRNTRIGTFEFVLRTGISDDYVDPALFFNIVRIIESDPSRSISDGQVHGCTEDLLNELPSIKYGIIPDGDYSLSAEPLIQIIIAPEDYLEQIAEGVCVLRMQPRDQFNTLGMNFLSKVGVLFDYTNRQIGFCDPL